MEKEYLNGKPIVITENEEGQNTPWIRKVRFDRENCVVELLGDNDRWLYEVDMERAQTSEELLSVLFHISAKSWGVSQVLGAILLVIDRVIRETTPRTAEHYYCYRMTDKKEPNGFDWTEHMNNDYEMIED